MSFLKISDPVKRDSIVKEYLELKKNIRLSERTVEKQLQTDLSNFLNLLQKRKQLQRQRLRKNLSLLKKA